MNYPRDDDDDVVYYNPAGEIYTGLWILFAAATVFFGLRLWVKLTRRHGLWYDDYVLLFAYVSDPKMDASFCRLSGILADKRCFSSLS